MWSQFTNVTDRQTDRRTDRQTTCDRNTALCTKVHRAVKTNYIASQKTMQNYFCHNFVKFPPTLIIFGKKMANSIKSYEGHSTLISTSPTSHCDSYPTSLQYSWETTQILANKGLIQTLVQCTNFTFVHTLYSLNSYPHLSFHTRFYCVLPSVRVDQRYCLWL